MLKALYAFLIALPEIIEFIKLMQEKEQEKADAENLKKKMQKVNQAFKDKDAKTLNDAFSDN